MGRILPSIQIALIEPPNSVKVAQSQTTSQGSELLSKISANILGGDILMMVFEEVLIFFHLPTVQH